MQLEIQRDTNLSFESRDNVMASAKYGSDASEALSASSYASSPAGQMSRNLGFHSVQSGISSSERDLDLRPELDTVAAYIVKQESPKTLPARSLKRELCDGMNAIKAAIALDERRLPDALQLLQDCATAASALSHGRNRLENFVRGVNGNERNGIGLDLDYSYGGSGYDKSFVDGFEIK